MNYKHLVDLNDLTKTEWEDVVNLAVKICDNPNKYSDVCKGKILATLFYEPSTRTQMSFQSAMIRLGGNIIGFDNPQNTSVSKGENLVDTIKIVSGYADVLVMRHPLEGAALAGAQYAECAIINAGDGGHLHPTQTLTDLVTLVHEIGHSDNLTLGLCGDLKNGRTVHSLIKAMCHYKNIRFILISTTELTLPDFFKQLIENSSCSYEEVLSLEEAIPLLDVLYMTRIQKERFASEELYNQQKDIYILDKNKLKNAKTELKILHPLPRIDEISMEVDLDPRAVYFKQAKYGVYARMALIMTILGASCDETVLKGCESEVTAKGLICDNPKCITNTELYLKKSFLNYDGSYYCEYCDNKCQ